MDGTCIVCNLPFGDQSVVKLGDKGSESVNRASINRGADMKTELGQCIHVNCRRDYIHKRNIKTNVDNNNNDLSSSVTRRSANIFEFKTKCMFCGTDAKFNNKKRGPDVFPVRTFNFQEFVKKKCVERNDNWGDTLLCRLSAVIDLPAAEARYHQTCNVNFRTDRQIPKQFQSSSQTLHSPGRPEKASKAFNFAMKYIEENADGKTFTVSDIVEIMAQKCDEDSAYSVKHMKRKLQEHFGDAVMISSLDGKQDIITLKETTATIIHSFAKTECETSDENEKARIIKAAAKLIKADIDEVKAHQDLYPSPDSVGSLEENLNYIPDSLEILLTTLFSSKGSNTKVGSIGQAIMQATRPRGIIAPLQVGLGVQMHRQFGSHFLVDTLHKLGFCSSYTEIQRFEMNCAKTLNLTIPAFSEGKFLQFVSDNVDHNIGTLDGNDTYHGMGTIACVTPATKITTQIPRKEITIEEVAEIGRIKIQFFSHKEHEPIFFRKLQVQNVEPQPMDFFCKMLWPKVPKRPMWSGFMQLYDSPKEECYPGVSAITFLPMIDLNPSDLNCIYTTMSFVCDLAKTYGVTPVLTFDQPLFAKATYIAQCEQNSMKNIVLRLGAFHTEMSFLGSIGHLMAGSGLQELLATAYAPNAVIHMMSGKAVARAVRGHFLVDTALHAILLHELVGISHPAMSENYEENESCEMGVDQETSYEDSENETSAMNNHEVTEFAGAAEYIDKEMSRDTEEKGHVSNNSESNVACTIGEHLAITYQSLENNQCSIQQISEDTTLSQLYSDVQEYKSKIRKENRTGSLWIQYMEMISILQNFIRAERTGNWKLHLSSLQEMLPYFAASGHNLYLKSAYIYLQNMRELEEKHPCIHKMFLDGNHVVRRSDRNWAGLSTDLTIEQVLMRSLKTSGGLTRGRGMTDAQRSLWLLSMPATAEMNVAMQTYTGSQFQTSEQHKECSKSRIARDEKDVIRFLQFLTDHNPFDETHTSEALRNIETGVTCGPKVNVDSAAMIGSDIIDDIVGQSFSDYSFKRSKQAVTLASSSSLTVKGETLSIDPQLLFQRLTTVARYGDDYPDLFKYELSSVPSSLFDTHGLLREPQKSVLAESIWKLGNCSLEHNVSYSDAVHVIDGGSLIQKLPWQKGTFNDIFEQYYEYLRRRYNNYAVVFDGYATGPSTKDTAHTRRAKGGIGPKVVFDQSTPFRGRKDTFLRNTENKQRFIELLGEQLSQHGIHVCYAEGDADVLIVKTALEYASTKPVAVIGEDTDLLVLLCYHTNHQHCQVIFKSDNLRNLNRRVWDIQRTQTVLGKDACQLLPFLHALSGCDTTSRMFGVGKAAALKLLLTNKEFRKLSMQLMNAKTEEEISTFGEMCIVKLYDTSWNMSLDRLRFQKFARKVTVATTCVQVHVLPPTSDAARFHIHRVYLQTQTWIDALSLNPCDWGWEMHDGQLIPVKTKLPPAPEELLKVIRCSCKINCDTKRCSCRKHGLECSVGCGECRGVSCTNGQAFDCMHDNETESDDSNVDV